MFVPACVSGAINMNRHLSGPIVSQEISRGKSSLLILKHVPFLSTVTITFHYTACVYLHMLHVAEIKT